jgi:hypothetical protein
VGTPERRSLESGEIKVRGLRSGTSERCHWVGLMRVLERNRSAQQEGREYASGMDTATIRILEKSVGGANICVWSRT